MRLIIAGIVGGVVIFLVSFVTHVVLPLGAAGISILPNEQAVMDTMRANITKPGFYLFPGMDMSKTPTAEEQAAWEEKYRSGPRGLLVYHPTGTEPMSAGYLLAELASNIAAGLIGALVLLWIPSFGKRVAAAALFGVIAWVSVTFSYWNWYGFPSAYVASELTDHVAGWLLAGIAMAFILKTKE